MSQSTWLSMLQEDLARLSDPHRALCSTPLALKCSVPPLLYTLSISKLEYKTSDARSSFYRNICYKEGFCAMILESIKSFYNKKNICKMLLHFP